MMYRKYSLIPYKQSSSVWGFFQARILAWAAISPTTWPSWPRDQTWVSSVSCIAGRFFTHWAIGEACVCVCLCVCIKSLQSCLTLCDLMDRSPADSSVHGILQARLLEWVAISFSRGSSWTRDRTCVSQVYCIDLWVLYH